MVMDMGAVSAVDYGVYRCAFGDDRADGVWVAEMMDAVEFLKEKDRMCRAICIVGGFVGRGDKCEIERQRERGQTCGGYMINHPEEAVEIVERWAKETSEEDPAERVPEDVSEGEHDRRRYNSVLPGGF